VNKIPVTSFATPIRETGGFKIGDQFPQLWRHRRGPP
jgi:hypothetical protein